MTNTISMKPFASRKKHNFDRFQDVSVKFWEYLNGLEDKLEMELIKVVFFPARKGLHTDSVCHMINRESVKESTDEITIFYI